MSDINLALPNTREGYRSLLESLNLNTDAGKEAYLTMLQMAEGADKYYTALEEVQQNFIDAQGTIVSTVQGYVDKLKSARESLKMEGSITAAQSLASAKLAFNAVLEQARTGNLSGIASIDSALSIMTSAANSSSGFASLQDYQRNFYQTYNSIAELEGLAGSQLSIAEQTLNVLKDQLAVMQGKEPSGNYAYGGISDGSDSGYTATLHGRELIVSPRASYPATVKGDNVVLISELRALREDLKMVATKDSRYIEKTARWLEKFDNDGIAVRV